MMAKKISFIFLATIFCLTTAVCLMNARADDDIPKAEKFSRYEPMLKHSPFAVATAALPAGALPDFAKDLYIANAAHSANGDFVTVASTSDHNFKEYLTTKEPVDGYSVPSIQWSSRVGETKVTIVKDGQTATLSFNEAILGQPLPTQTQQPPPPVPGPIRPGVNPIARPGLPQYPIPTPQPHTRGIIRRPQPNQARPPLPGNDEPGG